MNLMRHPELIDQLAASYALGTLRHGARRRFETLARTQPSIAQACRAWQSRLAGLTELELSVEPPGHVWIQIENLVAGGTRSIPEPKNPRPSWWPRLFAAPQSGWKWASAAGALATVVILIVSVQRIDELEQSSAQRIAEAQAKSRLAGQALVLAVMTDRKMTPTLLVTADKASGTLTLQRLTSYKEAEDQSLQLWALPAGDQPRSLGVLGPEQVMRIPASAEALEGVAAMAVSLEVKGGVPGEGGPKGPVLFSGPVISRQS